MSVQVQSYVSLAITAVLAGTGIIMAGTPESFGLSEVVVRWLGVVVAILSVVQTQMGRVTPKRLSGKAG